MAARKPKEPVVIDPKTLSPRQQFDALLAEYVKRANGSHGRRAFTDFEEAQQKQDEAYEALTQFVFVTLDPQIPF